MSSHPDIVNQILKRKPTKNLDEDSAQSGVEPPSGVQGKGTADQPYDQGNAPGTAGAQSGQEPVSGVQGKGTTSEPYDQGNAGESTTSSQPTNTSTTNGAAASKPDSSKIPEERLNSQARKRSEARDVSPGTMPDGTHATTAGDRGEGYEPNKGLSKLKGKLGIGKH